YQEEPRTGERPGRPGRYSEQQTGTPEGRGRPTEFVRLITAQSLHRSEPEQLLWRRRSPDTSRISSCRKREGAQGVPGADQRRDALILEVHEPRLTLDTGEQAVPDPERARSDGELEA